MYTVYLNIILKESNLLWSTGSSGKCTKGGRTRYDSNVSVTLNHVMKNNGTELDGITIMEKDKNIAPTIYINSFYDRYREGVSLKAVVSEIIRIYNTIKIH